MALTQRVIFSSYAFVGSADQTNNAMGTARNFPSGMCTIRATAPGTTGGPNNVTLLSVVSLLPSGLNQRAREFYTADSITTLNTNGS